MNTAIGSNALHAAVAEKKIKLIKILLQGGTDVNGRAYDGKTALMIACCYIREEDHDGDISEIIRLLLENKTDPNLQDLKGRSALMYALVYLAPITTVKLLLKYGADPYICDKYDKNAFCFISKTYWSQYMELLRPYVRPKKRLLSRVASAIVDDHVDIDEVRPFYESDTKDKNAHHPKYQKNINILSMCSTFEKITNETTDVNMSQQCAVAMNCLLSIQTVAKHTIIDDDVVFEKVSQIHGCQVKHNLCETELKAYQNTEALLLTTQEEGVHGRKQRQARAYSLHGDNLQIPASVFGRRQSCPEAKADQTSNKNTIYMTDGKNKCVRNSNIDVSSVDKKFLTNGVLRFAPKLPPIKTSFK
ncbi:unnamed protein product [Mytilus coruscus]|uniref:Uncharacterized protein n=1 Tax=Mytilus coruscus TaxID=42192 RepID=A0A6J8B8U3_MYTCO|nr:unnamed protein product [Mytilus coruscus]